MRIKLVSLEDGITSCGFRKMAAFATRIEPDTESLYITTKRYLGLRNTLFGSYGIGEIGEPEVDEIAHGLADADLVGFSSMTGYADITRRVIRRVRQLRPEVFTIWGGIHPIIHPEDAITADVDAICTGEGEFAFAELLEALAEGRDHTKVKNFWFKRGEKIVRNGFLPLMSAEAMETLPFPQYGEGERIYREHEGFVAMRTGDYLANDGLTYTTLWSIGCPFHCTYCGNTKFIANDPKYKRIRHPSARYIVEEVKAARRRFPHISHVSFHDDSFMAIPYAQLEEFAECWHDELGIPFAVYGVIPNYVKREKFEILTWAGMNRIRMGIQSGSEEILDFYKRPTPPAKIRAAADVIGSFTPKYHIPPSYDIIMDNPVETRQDVIDTLELLYELPRPYTLFIYSLKVIPNTDLEQALKERGIDLDEIDSSYASIPPRAANLLLYVLTFWRPPRWLFSVLLRRVHASSTPQPLYPRLGLVLRAAYLAKKVLNHLRFMDFSLIPGWSGYVAWRSGMVRLWQRRVTRRLPRPTRPASRPAPAKDPAAQLTPVSASVALAGSPAAAVRVDTEAGSRGAPASPPAISSTTNSGRPFT
jgi:anaerobic magnesium-protoporphyrin IX monomethyl ester cyclase